MPVGHLRKGRSDGFHISRTAKGRPSGRNKVVTGGIAGLNGFDLDTPMVA